MQRDDMSVDLHAHGSRELAHDVLPADNQYCAEEGAAEPAAEDAAAVEPANRQMAKAITTEVEATHSFLDFEFWVIGTMKCPAFPRSIVRQRLPTILALGG